MALDRPATLTMPTPGSRNEYGEWVPGVATEYRVWLTRIDAPADRELNPEGNRTVQVGRFRTRWFAALAGFDVSRDGSIAIDGEGQWRLTGVDETDAGHIRSDQARPLRSRRRFLTLTAIRTDVTG